MSRFDFRKSLSQFFKLDGSRVISPPATALWGIKVSMEIKDYTGVAENYGIYLNKEIAAGDSATGFISLGLYFSLRNRRDLFNAASTMMVTRALRGSCYDVGFFQEDIDYETDLSTRELMGLWFQAIQQTRDYTKGDNDIECYGAYMDAESKPRLYKGDGTLTSVAYGVYAYGYTDPIISTGAFVATTYGVYAEGKGTTEGTQTVYGIFAKASGGDVNWSGYFDVADVKITQDLELDGVLRYETGDYIDYDATNNRYLFYIGAAVIGYVDAAGFHNGAP